MNYDILQRIKIVIIVFVFSATLWGAGDEAHAAVTFQPAQGPLTGAVSGYTSYPDLQFYSPVPPAMDISGKLIYDSTYNYGCEQSSAGVLRCHKMKPLEDLNDRYECGNTTTSPNNLVDLGSAWLFNNCGFAGDILSPSQVTVTVTPVSTSQITVSWTESFDNIGVTYYKVFRYKGACCFPAAISPDITISAPTTTYSHTGLSAGTTYGYYVLAYDAAGNYSGSAGPVYATTFSDGIPPTDPTNLAALAVSTSQINLSWTPSTDTGGSELAGYHIERCTGVGCEANLANFAWIADTTTAGFSNTGLAPSTSYAYRVRAYDDAGNNSGYSLIDSDTTWAPLDTTPPTPAPVLSGSALSSTQIQLKWTASTDPETGVANYRVYRDDSLIYTTLDSTVLIYNDSGLSAETPYTYRVDAVNGGGLITQSSPLTITTPAVPDTLPPVFIPNSPDSTLSAGTTSATLGGTTDESATCWFSTTSGLAFSAMTSFSTTGGTNHIYQPIPQPLEPQFVDGGQYTYYVKCRDTAGNISGDFTHMFKVDSPAPDLTPPGISGGTPTGVLTADTVSATISVVTDENAYCRYNSGSDTTWSLMPNVFSTTGATAHSALLTNLTNGSSYSYYVRCQDNPAGNVNTSGYAISFVISFPLNTNPVALIAITPSTSGTAPFAISANGSGSYDSDGTITQYTWNWGDGSASATGVGPLSHTYATAGSYNLSLKVVDNQGGSHTAYQMITVSAAPPPPPPSVNVCTADCTDNSDCTAPNICGPSKFCIAQSSLVGPIRSDFYLSRTDGSMSQQSSQQAAFPAGTASVIMSMQTDVNAECQYSTVSGTLYDASAMKTFTNTGTLAHSVTLTGLASKDASTHIYYVRCRDLATGIVNDNDQAISFIIGAPFIVSGPNPYMCLINADYVRDNIPYIFDICVPK